MENRPSSPLTAVFCPIATLIPESATPVGPTTWPWTSRVAVGPPSGPPGPSGLLPHPTRHIETSENARSCLLIDRLFLEMLAMPAHSPGARNAAPVAGANRIDSD